jgi:hypothetical protein
MQQGISRFVFFAIILLFSASAHTEEPWQFKFTKDGISVKARPVAGSEYIEFIGTGMINATPELCMKIMNDPDSYKNWMSSCIYSKELPGRQGKSFTYYIESYSPWPVSNRDGIYSTTFVEKDGNFTYINTAINRKDLVPEKKNTVRQIYSIAHWIFIKKDGGIELSYYIRTNPGGSLSPSLFNATGTDIPYKNLMAFRKRIAELTK